MSEGIITLLGDHRARLGTDESRRIRKAGSVPCVVYLRGLECKNIVLSMRALLIEYRKRNIIGRLFNIDVGGVVTLATLYDLSFHPVTGVLEHVEFHAVVDGRVLARVPVVFYNNAGCLPVKRGAFLNVVRRVLAMECSIDDYKEEIKVDLKDAAIGQSYRVSDLSLPASCKLRGCTPNTLVARFMGKKAVAVEAVADAKPSAAKASTATKSAPAKVAAKPAAKAATKK